MEILSLCLHQIFDFLPARPVIQPHLSPPTHFITLPHQILGVRPGIVRREQGWQQAVHYQSTIIMINISQSLGCSWRFSLYRFDLSIVGRVLKLNQYYRFCFGLTLKLENRTNCCQPGLPRWRFGDLAPIPTLLSRLVACCSRPSDGMPGLDPTLDEKEIIL